VAIDDSVMTMDLKKRCEYP